MKTLIWYAALLLISGVSGAQAPQWTVVVTPTLNPLPLGMCGAVHLTLMDPVTRDVPRNPQGYRISMADFDMSVSGGTSAAGHQIDASHFEACGCQGGAAGSTATVTARYPAQSLPAANRVTGVSIQQSATFSLAMPKGAVNPQSCIALASAGNSNPAVPADPRAANNSPPSGTPPGGTIAPQTNPAPSPTAPVTSTPVAVATTTSRVPVAVVPQTPVSTTAPVVPVNPSGLTAGLIPGGEIGLAWNQVPGASFYVVFGPGFTPGGQRVENAIDPRTGPNHPQVLAVATNVPAGNHQWQVASYYNPGNVSTSAAEFSRVSFTVSAPETAAAPAPASTPANNPASSPAPVLSGKYLVTLTGIRCYQASMDDMLSRDGKGDEVYAATYIRRYDRRTAELVDTSTRQSASHGDVQYFGNQRLQAGSGSQTGGVQDGDMIPGPALIATRSVLPQDVTFPMRLWEGTLTDGVDALIMSPSLWEQDGGDSYYNQWLQNQQTLNLSLFAKQGVQDQISQNAFGAVIFGMSGNDSNASGLSMGKLVVDTGMMALGAGVPILSLLTTSADRPLGLVQNGRDVTALPNHTVILTREIIEAALAKPPIGAIPSPVANAPPLGVLAGGVPPIARIGVIAPKPGVIVVHLQERDISGTLAFPERPAIYQMYIQVERIP